MTTVYNNPAGVDENCEGRVVRSPGIRVGYLEQEPRLDDGATVMDNIEPAVAHIRWGAGGGGRGGTGDSVIGEVAAVCIIHQPASQQTKRPTNKLTNRPPDAPTAAPQVYGQGV
jgi:hypothetical protein